MDTMPIDVPRQAGLYVRRSREAQGLTRAQLACAAGVSERSLASLELGDATGIRLDKLLAVLEALGLSLAVQGENIAGTGKGTAGRGVQSARSVFQSVGAADMQADGCSADARYRADALSPGVRMKASSISKTPGYVQSVSEAGRCCGIEDYRAALRDFIVNDMGVLLASEVR